MIQHFWSSGLESRTWTRSLQNRLLFQRRFDLISTPNRISVLRFQRSELQKMGDASGSSLRIPESKRVPKSEFQIKTFKELKAPTKTSNESCQPKGRKLQLNVPLEGSIRKFQPKARKLQLKARIESPN